MARMLSVDADTIKKPTTGNSDPSSSAGLNDGGKNNWRLLGLVMFFLFYLAFGASVFSAIESPVEKRVTQKLMERKQNFLLQYPCLKDHDLEEFMMDIVDANNRGVSIFQNEKFVPSWSFGQAFFFASTVVTTIGYGHQSPLTHEGKIFCMVYALIGIPMTMILLAAVVERLLIPISEFLQWMMDKLGAKYQPIYIFIMHFSMVSGVVIILFFLVPAIIFMSLEEKWNFLDALYYCFISLTTIGLGDFIPGDTPGQSWRPLYKACTTFYLLLGVTAMMLTLSVFYHIPKCNLKLLFVLPTGGYCLEQGNGGQNASVGDPERIRLQATGSSGPKYTQHLDEPTRGNKRFVRARSRPNDDSPDEDQILPSSSAGD